MLSEWYDDSFFCWQILFGEYSINLVILLIGFFQDKKRGKFRIQV